MYILEDALIGLLEITAHIIMQYGWFIACCYTGFIFRRDRYRYKLWNLELCNQTIARRIFYLILLTILWNGITIFEDNVIMMTALIFSTCIYVIYYFMEQYDGKSIEGILVVVNSLMMPMLSMLPFPHNVIWSIVTLVLTVTIYYLRKGKELRSECFEIILLCGETLLASAIISKNNWNNIFCTVGFVIFCETFVYMINFVLKYEIRKVYNENVDEYGLDLYEW